MAEKHAQKGGRNNANKDRNQNKNKDRKDKEEKRKPFVPWLGEERPSKGPILDLATYEGKKIAVTFSGGREIEGILTGHDQLMNMVLEEVVELLDAGATRPLGKLVVRGPLLQTVSPVEGTSIIDNPY